MRVTHAVAVGSSAEGPEVGGALASRRLGVQQVVNGCSVRESIDLEPGPVQSVVVDGGAQIPVFPSEQAPAQRDALPIPLHAVVSRRAVPPVWVGLEIGGCQAEVGLVGDFTTVTELQLDAVDDLFREVAAPASLEHGVLAEEARRSTAVQLLEAIRGVVRDFSQDSPLLGTVAGESVGLERVEGAVGGVHLGNRGVDGNAACSQVDRAADGLRSVSDSGGSFDDFDPDDAHRHGEVVRRGRRIWGGRHGYAVLQQGDLCASVGVAAPQPDVRAQPKAVLVSEVDPRHGGEDLVDVRVLELLQRLLIDDVCSTGDAGSSGFRCDDHGPVAAVVIRFLSMRDARKSQEHDCCGCRSA